ncbi:hypothetical protein [Thermogymnomonas acidicola]|uniref:hypothetical protein n=1 Tax=Thermogymnomonas acidicola TaxID=399579 RepID=UPI00166794F2|nr:hypothetical protein [Thermogymnomonas acidicola]
MTSDPYSDGAFYLYQFSCPSAEVLNSNISNTTVPMSSTGILYLKIQGKEVNVQIVDQMFVPGIVRYVQHTVETYPLSNGFVRTILNNDSLERGSIVPLPGGLIGSVIGPSRFSFSIGYSGNNSTLLRYSREIGTISPVSVSIYNFNISGVPRSYLTGGSLRSPNEYQYASTGNSNVLVIMQASGNSDFLDTLYHSANTTLVRTLGFYMTTVGTSVWLSPLDYGHYLLRYIGIEIFVWVFGLSYLVVLRHRVRTKDRTKVIDQVGGKDAHVPRSRKPR